MDDNILQSHFKPLTTSSSLGPLVRFALAFWTRGFINAALGCVMPLMVATVPVPKCGLVNILHHLLPIEDTSRGCPLADGTVTFMTGIL